MNDGHDPDIDARLRAAMHKLGEGYRTADQRGEPAVRSGARRRSMWWTSIAAATVLAVGVGIGVALTRTQDNAQPAVADTANSVPTSPPSWIDQLTVPNIPLPELAVQIDEEIVGEPLELQDPYVTWVHSIEPLDTVWYVKFEADRAVSSITVADHPAWAWDVFDARIPTGPDHGPASEAPDSGRDSNSTSWRNSDGSVRVVSAAGEASTEVDQLAADYRDDLDSIRAQGPPEGYTELTTPEVTGWQVQPSSTAPPGWTAAVYVPEPNELDRYLATWSSVDDAEDIPGGWLAGSEDSGWTAVVAVDGFVVRVGVAESVPAATMRDIGAHLRLVAASAVPMTSPFARRAVEPAPTPVLAGGETSIGRWAAFDTTLLEAEPGDVCQRFFGVLRGLDGCLDAGEVSWTRCRTVAGTLGSETSNHVVLLTTEALDPDDRFTATVAGETAVVTVERSGGFTFVHGELPTGAPTGTRHISIVDSDGNELCP